MSEYLKDKVVVITGGRNGIGAATVSLCLEKSAKVASLDILDAEATTNEYLLNINCNVSSEDACNNAVKEVLEKWGTVDVLVNCAAVMDNMERTSDCPTSTWNKVLGVNINGPFYLMRAVLRQFLTKTTGHKGSIVNIASTAGIKGGDAGAAYTASKHAIIGLTKSTAWMYAKDGIRCNVLIPGGVKTNILENSKAKLDAIGSQILYPVHQTMPGWLEPIDVARAIVFLAGATGVNGAQWTIDHGWSIA